MSAIYSVNKDYYKGKKNNNDNWNWKKATEITLRAISGGNLRSSMFCYFLSALRQAGIGTV